MTSAVLATAAATAPASARRAKAPLDRLTALVKLRGSTDGRIGFVWQKGMRRAVSGGRSEPMCGLLHCSIIRYSRQAPDAYRFDLYETSFYTNPLTGQYQPTLKMPFTGREVEVPLYRTGPGLHVVKLRNREEMSWSRQNTTSEDAARMLAPDGKIVYEIETSEPIIQGNTIFMSTSALTVLTPYDPAQKPWRYEEYFSYAGRLDEVLDPNKTSASVTASCTLTMDWRPWMQMGDLPGMTLDHAVGGRVWRVDDLPSDIVDHLRRLQPDVLENPARWLPELS
jgi:hypothetical protein